MRRILMVGLVLVLVVVFAARVEARADARERRVARIRALRGSSGVDARESLAKTAAGDRDPVARRDAAERLAKAAGVDLEPAVLPRPIRRR